MFDLKQNKKLIGTVADIQSRTTQSNRMHKNDRTTAHEFKYIFPKEIFCQCVKISSTILENQNVSI